MNYDAPKHIYFLQPRDDTTAPIKIGCSIEPAKRLIDFSRWSPYPLALLAYAPGTHPDEAKLHRIFSADRSHLEWFFPSEKLIGLIEIVRATGQLPTSYGSDSA